MFGSYVEQIVSLQLSVFSREDVMVLFLMCVTVGGSPFLLLSVHTLRHARYFAPLKMQFPYQVWLSIPIKLLALP